MIDNPFTSSTYQKIWINHFMINKSIRSVGLIDSLNFYKTSWMPLYVNCGRNMTNGITYRFFNNGSLIKNSAVLIFDVPSFHLVELQNQSYRLKKIAQYSGHLLNLKNYDSINAFLKNHFNAKSRGKFRGYFNKLEKDHEVEYEVLGADVLYDTYMEIMQEFKVLLETRFDDLGVENDILTKWAFYMDLVYPMLQEKKAILNVIRVDGKVGAISLAFLSKDSVIGAIKAFDITFGKYSLGVLELIKLLEWSIDNGYDIFDFSKGDQDYKKRFATDSYIFDCHIIYDSKNFKSLMIANGVSTFYKFKQYLRKKNFNKRYWKLKHRLRFR
ncbi:hypothetical protein C1T31_08485 [Hanstruepera neustonica]|uniref:BioF2-like acetyltransferase domain-containing protein n=1 Tax=Hanstruepera neustonica TaxID=1445657 RepID=A0A2K1DYC7_9FLAO|nr:GNAT family N-acetyltransferase [Hanstruepera neustonica]PNQ73022.1 hypothetical protein C1T31_08485 [Hanstruepera neustonica]